MPREQTIDMEFAARFFEDFEPEPEPAREQSAGDSAKVQRARSYIAKMPDAVQGEKGSNALFSLCCKLYEFGLTDAEALSVVLSDYNPRCKPEWTDAEIRHKLDGARRRVEGEGKFGAKAKEERRGYEFRKDGPDSAPAPSTLQIVRLDLKQANAARSKLISGVRSVSRRSLWSGQRFELNLLHCA